MLGICIKYCLYLFLRMAVRMLWKEKEKCRIRAVQMDNLRELLGIRRMDRVLNARIKELSRVAK